MSKIMLISSKDNNFYNFRSEFILKLQSMGHEVVLVCPYGKKIDYFIKHGCRFIDISVDRRGKNVFKDTRLLYEYYILIKREKPDVVLTYTTKPSVFAGFVCRIIKTPYIINNAGIMEAHGLFDLFLNFLYQVSFKKASCIMCQNSFEKEKIQSLLHNAINCRSIPGSGVNLSEFTYQPYPENNDEIIFNYVARIVKVKGIDEMLECAKRVKKEYPKVKFVIYGDYDDYSYQKVISDFEKMGIVEYGGIQINMKPFIETAHAVIHPSYYEGMTNVVLEHSAMGRVCIGSKIPGVCEGIDDNKTGFLFDVKDIGSMVEAVKKFINLPYEEKVAMGKAAREKMERYFSRDIVTNVYLEELLKILELS